MKSRKFTVVLCAAVLSGYGLLVTAAQASPKYSYVATLPGSNAVINNLPLQVGGPSQTLAICLLEQGGSLISADGGLYSGGFSMAWTSGANPALLNSVAGYGANFPGGTSAEPAVGDSVSLRRYDSTVATAVYQAGTGGPVPNASGLIELGTVTIAPGSAPGTTIFTIWDYDQSTNASTIINHGYTQTNGSKDYYLDVPASSNGGLFSGNADNPTIFTVTTTSVPEPASLTLLMCGSLPLLVRLRRGT
jgi:hypothetical protein